MNFKKMIKQTTILTFTAALMLGGATQTLRKEITSRTSRSTMTTVSLISLALTC